MTFDEWAEAYALDDDWPTRTGRREDCKAAWEAAAAHEREVCADLCDINGKDAPTRDEREMAAACADTIRRRSNEQT